MRRRAQVTALVLLAAIPLAAAAYLALLVVALPALRLGDERRAEGIALAAAVAGPAGRPERVVARMRALGVDPEAVTLVWHGSRVTVVIDGDRLPRRIALLGGTLRLPRGAVAAARPIRTQDGARGAVLVEPSTPAPTSGSASSLR